MKNGYIVLAVFDYSSEAQVIKAKLESENIRTMFADETTVDSDPLISNAIGGVKLLVHEEDLTKAIEIYNQVRVYETDEDNNPISCPICESQRILIAPPLRKNIFYMLFPFFEKTRHICNECKLTF